MAPSRQNSIPIVVPTLSGYDYDPTPTAGVDCHVVVVKDEKHEMFTKTVNRGLMRVLPSEFVVILNDDAFPSQENWLRTLLEPFSNPQVGAVGPSGLCSTRPQCFGTPYMDREPQVVAQLAFFCVVIRGSVFDVVGLLDESFLHYGSDNDFILRMIQWGMLAVWQPRVYVVHRHRGSGVLSDVKKRDRDTLAKKWPGLVHGPVRKLRRFARPSRETARVVLGRFQRQGMAGQ